MQDGILTQDVHVQQSNMDSTAKPVSLRISTIVHATEDSRKVSQAIRNICQLEGSAEPEATRAKGHHGNQIMTLALTVKSPKDVENCVRNIWRRLSTLDKETLLSGLASRVDTSGALFLRIDKQESLRGNLILQDSDPIKVEISFKISPSKQDGVVNTIQKFLEEISPDDPTSR